MIWISAEDVILIHSRVIEGSGGLDGLRDRDGLEAAVSAPMQTFDGKELYPTDLDKIARLGFGLASTHANWRICSSQLPMEQQKKRISWTGFIGICVSVLLPIYFTDACKKGGKSRPINTLRWLQWCSHRCFCQKTGRALCLTC